MVLFKRALVPLLSRLSRMNGSTEATTAAAACAKPAKSLTSAKTFEKVVEGKEWVAVRENSAEVLFPNKTEVFYNPVQEFNRDLSIAVLRLQAEDFCTGVLRKKGGAEDNVLSSEEFRSLRFGEKHEVLKNCNSG
jgi:tRNA (guanine26-N2/guanine27-N2)-dimethyltransferase